MIMEAAKPLFAERGFDGVTTRDIAKAAGVHLGSLHHFFPQKSDLYEAVLISAFAATNRKFIDTLDDTMPPEERFRGFVAVCFAHFASGETDATLIDREYLGRPLPDEQMQALFGEMHGALHPVMAALAPKGRTPAEIGRITAFIFSLIFGAAKLNPLHKRMLEHGDAWSAPEVVDDLCRFALTAITADRGS